MQEVVTGFLHALNAVMTIYIVTKMSQACTHLDTDVSRMCVDFSLAI